MKIAVIGGKGYLGSHIVKYFGAESLSRRTGFDITDRRHCQILKEFDIIIHLAALVNRNIDRREDLFRVNIEGTNNIVDALEEHQTLIFASSKAIYSEDDPYGISKRMAEDHINFVQEYKHFRVGIFRLGTVYASALGGSCFVNFFAESIKKGTEFFVHNKGKQKRDFLYVDDFSKAIESFLKLKKVSDTYDIGGGIGNSVTIIGLVRMIEQMVQKKGRVRFVPGQSWGPLNFVTDLTEIKKKLNWAPKVSLEEGIRRLIQ